MISDSGLEFNSLQPSSAESAEVRVPFRPMSASSVKSNLPRGQEDGQEGEQQGHAAGHGIDEELRRGGSAQRSTPEPDEEERRDQAQFPEDEPVEEVQGGERAEEPGLQEKHQREIERHALLDVPRGQHGHRHHDGREQHHQQPESIHANAILDTQRGNPGVPLLKLKPARCGVELDATAPKPARALPG